MGVRRRVRPDGRTAELFQHPFSEEKRGERAGQRGGGAPPEGPAEGRGAAAVERGDALEVGVRAVGVGDETNGQKEERGEQAAAGAIQCARLSFVSAGSDLFFSHTYSFHAPS